VRQNNTFIGTRSVKQLSKNPVMMASSAEPVVGILFSGGLDSAILLGTMLEDARVVQPFYVRSGLNWESAELLAAREFLAAMSGPRLRSLVVLDMPLHDLYGTHWAITGVSVPDANSPDEAVYLPGRNALLFTKVAVWCQLHGIPELALATLGTSPFPDASAEFISHFQAMINLGASFQVRFSLPFSGMSKLQVMELGRKFPLNLTLSCISPVNGLSCGKCNKCAERDQAFSYLRTPPATVDRRCTT
jgi:7-cyano-7-deazaguanine synthase